jgi:DNA-directed RNA polymerase subunit RPC12/RpoP
MDTAPAPENRPPTLSKAPPPGKKFPCPQCGARLDFDPGSRGLTCPYCGHRVVIEPDSRGVEERPLAAYLDRKKSGAKVLEGRSSQVTCNACGAVVLLEEKVATDRCPYCSSHLENRPQAAEGMIEPEGVLPFKVQQKQAVEAFERWLHGLWFAPGTLKHFANLGQLTGFYVPFWTFDSMTYTRYRGERGDDYQVQETYTDTETYTDSNGQTQTRPVTKTRTVTHTRWTSVSGEVDHFFDDILICASQGLPDKYSSRITPDELGELEEFRPEFLSGFKTERYVIDPEQGFERARLIMDGRIKEMCRRDIGGDHQRLHTVRTQHVGVTFKHVLLPVWMASYRYHDKSYRVVVNGRTGQVMGDRPYSVAKIVGLVLAVLLALLAVFLLVRYFQSRDGRGGPHRPRVVVEAQDPERGTSSSREPTRDCRPEESHHASACRAGGVPVPGELDPGPGSRRAGEPELRPGLQLFPELALQPPHLLVADAGEAGRGVRALLLPELLPRGRL